MISERIVRRLKAEREKPTADNVTVSIDQSFSNYAMVKFENGTPTDRCVFHTGDPTAKKNKFKEYGLYFESPCLQLNYLYECVLNKILEWNPQDIVMEGLAFNSKGSSERQLGALYFGLQVSLHRELGYPYNNLHSVTPTQCKSTAREFLPEIDKYAREATGEIVRLRSGKPKLNPMSDKKMILKALQNTEYSWLVDGYTHDGLVSSRKTETGLYDIPDAFFIGVNLLESKGFKFKRSNN